MGLSIYIRRRFEEEHTLLRIKLLQYITYASHSVVPFNMQIMFIPFRFEFIINLRNCVGTWEAMELITSGLTQNATGRVSLGLGLRPSF